MRLINAQTYKLEEFLDENEKKYAILSHRWEGEEVSFGDMQIPAKAVNMKGFAKIRNSCEHAVNDGYGYVWVDTCCINKDSSAEISEAINSMFRWYKASAVCYAFLADVRADSVDIDTGMQHLRASKWFKRGWTLQEFLAPEHVVFYDQQWNFLGTKQTLSAVLTLQTGIDEAILNGGSLSSRSIAQRMSWASERGTTCKEDIAYCLLGIFDVNMPLLYGEGAERAFLRLQEEIIKQSDDHTIFAWPIQRHHQNGLLADSPKAFAGCQYTKAILSRNGRSPYSLTNRGLSIKLLATPFAVDTYLVRLDCVDGLLPVASGHTGELRLGMFLRRLYEDDQFGRITSDGETFVQVNASMWNSQMSKPHSDLGIGRLRRRPMRPVKQLEINVRQVTNSNTGDYNDRINGFRIATPDILGRASSGQDLFKVIASQWDAQEKIMSMKAGESGSVGYLDIGLQNRKIELIKLGFDFDFNPVCFIATANGKGAVSHNLDRIGYINYGTEAQQAQWSTEEHAQFEGIHQRSPYDKLAWSEVSNGEAMELKQHPLWALKGDRVNGLTVRVGELASLRILRGIINGKLVWDVYLENVVKESMLRRILK